MRKYINYRFIYNKRIVFVSIINNSIPLKNNRLHHAHTLHGILHVIELRNSKY